MLFHEEAVCLFVVQELFVADAPKAGAMLLAARKTAIAMNWASRNWERFMVLFYLTLWHTALRAELQRKRGDLEALWRH